MRTTLTIFFLVLLLSSAPFESTKIEIVNLGNFNTSQEIRIKRILDNLVSVINSEHFKNQIINHKVGNEYKFENNKDESNEQIYIKLMSGAELLDQNKDSTWNFDINLRWLFSRSTLAYTNFDSPEIYINSRYFNRGDDAEIAGTICHEYLHKVGYSHDSRSTARRPNSVPYAIGYICESLYVNMFGLNKRQEQSCGLICFFKKLFNSDSN